MKRLFQAILFICSVFVILCIIAPSEKAQNAQKSIFTFGNNDTGIFTKQDSGSARITIDDAEVLKSKPEKLFIIHETPMGAECISNIIVFDEAGNLLKIYTCKNGQLKDGAE